MFGTARRRTACGRAALLVGAAMLGLVGCAELSYYSQAAHGHLDIMGRRAPIGELLADPATDAGLKARLELAREVRAFASAELALPDNGSYTEYADIERPFATWVVVATPALSVLPIEHCFPFAGCIAYRGYFAEADAQAFAVELAAQGLDVHVAGSPAYSTLGWFDDPLLNTMVNRPPWALARVVFHELAHQRYYLPGDSAFSEGYAVAVERAGVRRWLESTGRADELARYERIVEQRAAFTTAVLGARDQLAMLYASGQSDAAMREGKQAVFGELRRWHDSASAGWAGSSPFAHWFSTPLNNARLALVATYDAEVPIFMAMLEESEGEFDRFHAAVQAWGESREAAR